MTILVFNAGSSSLKFGVFDTAFHDTIPNRATIMPFQKNGAIRDSGATVPMELPINMSGWRVARELKKPVTDLQIVSYHHWQWRKRMRH